MRLQTWLTKTDCISWIINGGEGFEKKQTLTHTFLLVKL